MVGKIWIKPPIKIATVVNNINWTGFLSNQECNFSPFKRLGEITAKAGGDKLFGSVTNANIAEVLEANGHSIDRKFITSGVVKRVGKYTASVRLHRDVIVELAYEIVGEKA